MFSNFNDQNYAFLRKKARKSGRLFKDETFPADNSSLKLGNLQEVKWLRPEAICQNSGVGDPCLTLSGFTRQTRHDVQQGKLGNCWFVAAVSCVASRADTWNQLIPDYRDQEWDLRKPEKYCGIFHVRFWRSGVWQNVVIDDLLPTINGCLIFGHSKNGNEFWVPLVEKAYAKLHGSYKALERGNLDEAIEDFTGGVSEKMNLNKDFITPEEREKLFQKLLQNYEMGAFGGVSIHSPSQESELPNGLVTSHAYAISKIKILQLKDTKSRQFFGKDSLKMVRLRNPWGKTGWKGAFGNHSPEWNQIGKKEKNSLEIEDNDDGEFWMIFEDFVANFTDCVISWNVNTAFSLTKKTYTETYFQGAWTSPFQCGGCVNHETHLENPQYLLVVPQPKLSIIINLVHETERGSDSDGKTLSCGLLIYEADINRQYRVGNRNVLKSLDAFESQYSNMRSKIYRYQFEAGRYIVLPTTFDRGLTGKYLLRFFKSNNVKIMELNKGEPDNISSCCLFTSSRPTYKLVTRVCIKALECQTELKNQFCVIKCEGQKVKQFEGREEKVKISATFYRKKPEREPITIQVYISGSVTDQLFASVTAKADSVNKDQTITTYSVMGKDKLKKGDLKVIMQSSKMLTSL